MNNDRLHVVALNDEELNALMGLRGQLFIQKAPEDLGKELKTKELELEIALEVPTLKTAGLDDKGQQIEVILQGDKAKACLLQLNPEYDFEKQILELAPISQDEYDKRMLYHLRIQSSLSHLSRGVENNY
jgi:hypothetical protein